MQFNDVDRAHIAVVQFNDNTKLQLDIRGVLRGADGVATMTVATTTTTIVTTTTTTIGT